MKLTRRRLMLLSAAGATGIAEALSTGESGGKVFGGTMGLSKAYNVGGDLWIGPDSAKSSVTAKSGRVYMAADTDVDYYGDGSSWQLRSIGSSSNPVPSISTEEGTITDQLLTPAQPITHRAGSHGVHSINGPPAVYVESENKTFGVYRGTSADPYAYTYDHDLGGVTNHTKVGTNNISDTDAHGTPAMEILADGTIVVLYGAHGSPFEMATSTNAYDTSDWTDQGSVSGVPDGTYPCMVADGSDLYVFYRTGDFASHGSPYPAHEYATIIKSTDGGSSWTDLGPIIDTSGHPDSDSDAYVSGMQLHDGNLHLTWFVAHGSSHDDVRSNMYHAYYNPTDGNLYDLAGNSYGSTITWSEHSSGVLQAFNGDDVASASTLIDGTTVYVVFPHSDSSAGEIQWKLATYNSGWSVGQVADAKVNNTNVGGAIRLNDEGNVECYLPTNDGSEVNTGGTQGRRSALTKFVDNGGWESAELGPQGIHIVASVRNAHEELVALAAEYYPEDEPKFTQSVVALGKLPDGMSGAAPKAPSHYLEPDIKYYVGGTDAWFQMDSSQDRFEFGRGGVAHFYLDAFDNVKFANTLIIDNVLNLGNNPIRNFKEYADDSVPANNEMYFDTTDGQLEYKDSSGTIHPIG